MQLYEFVPNLNNYMIGLQRKKTFFPEFIEFHLKVFFFDFISDDLNESENSLESFYYFYKKLPKLH